MLLSVPLLAKSSFFGSLINKCRQVIKIKQKQTPTNNSTILTNPSTSSTTSTTSTAQININKNSDVNFLHRPIPAAANLSLSSITPSKTLEERIGLPARPKKPLTPYFRYMKEMRPKLMAEHPKTKLTEIVRLITKQWETVDPKMKERLQLDYKKDQEAYVQLRTKYDAKLTDKQREDIKQLKQEIIDAKERRMLRKRIKELDRPKKPASAYLLFIAEERKTSPQSPTQSYKDWHEKTTAKWTRMSAEDKEVYMKVCRKQLEKYRKEIAAWEEKMISQGNIDVVRHSNLIDPPEPKPRKS